MPPKKRSGDKIDSTISSKLKKMKDSKRPISNSNNAMANVNPSSSSNNSKALDFSFYNQTCEDLAKDLLGKTLVRLSDEGERLCGTIVETEAYLGHPDKAAHSYKGKTNKNEPMFMEPGTAYVYHIHSYCCMNISSQGILNHWIFGT